MLFFVLACIVPAFCLSWIIAAAMRRLAPRIGLVDQPAARKVHVTPTPLGGGIAIWLGVVVPLGLAYLVVRQLAGASTLPEWIPGKLAVHFDGVLYRSRLLFGILAGGTVLSLMGLYDDLRGLPWWVRLGVQFGVAVAMVLCGVQATVFVPVPWVGMLLTALWIVVLINSLNFLDNMDGLTSGISLIAASLFATVMLTSLSEPRWLVAGVLLVLAGSIAGFLWHNWPPAKIFMGDAGSTFIGLMLATMTVLGTFYEPSQSSRHTILAPLCVLAVPLYDFCSVVIIRLKEGRSPFHADKSHFSHRLVELGLSPRHAVLTIHLATLTTGLGAILLYEVPDWPAALIVVGLIGCVLGIVAILETAGRRKA